MKHQNLRAGYWCLRSPGLLRGLNSTLVDVRGSVVQPRGSEEFPLYCRRADTEFPYLEGLEPEEILRLSFLSVILIINYHVLSGDGCSSTLLFRIFNLYG